MLFDLECEAEFRGCAPSGEQPLHYLQNSPLRAMAHCTASKLSHRPATIDTSVRSGHADFEECGDFLHRMALQGACQMDASMTPE